ncbi:hypothetical protein A8924_2999 [Saccharopolyspora erythraea NRRL 2338]|nr:hypothetical protein A8924_2999 [Saccharopolyspora erythraea NRRL 2338]
MLLIHVRWVAWCAGRLLSGLDRLAVSGFDSWNG